MVPENTNDSPLLPLKHPQQELFLCDVADAFIKDDMASMEHPIFSLSKHPDFVPKTYHSRNKQYWLEVKCTQDGRATIYDKDILIYAISHLMLQKRRGRDDMVINADDEERTISFSARDLLVFTNRSTSGYQYKKLVEAFSRINGTRLRTNIKTAGVPQMTWFGLVDALELQLTEGAEIAIDGKVTNGRVVGAKLTLSKWLWNAVVANEVLTLHPDYFRLGKPLERRVYEIARKHCGNQDFWKVRPEILWEKVGGKSALKKFNFSMREMVRHDHLPDYRVTFEGGFYWFHLREKREKILFDTKHIRLKPETLEAAREVNGGYCRYLLEQQWRGMMLQKKEAPNNPDAAFLGFIRKYVERNGQAR